MKYSFSSLVVAACAVAGAVASPAVNVTGLQARAGTPSAEGTHDNFFYSWWTDNQGTAYYTNQAGGTYNLEWSGNNGNLVGGKGWNPGTENRVISYNGTYTPNGNSYLAVYGWTRNKLIEYYVVESYGTYNPASAASRKGTVTCNGASYDILSTWRNNQPSIDGTATFEQFWSVRNPKKNPGGAISGTVDFGCHVQAWRGVGMNLGTSHYYQIVATEGYFSSGRATITVSQGSGGGQPSTPVTVPSPPVTVPPSTSAPVTTPTQPPSSCSVSKYGQCGGQGFTGCTFCASGSTCQTQNAWYSQCL